LTTPLNTARKNFGDYLDDSRSRFSARRRRRSRLRRAAERARKNLAEILPQSPATGRTKKKNQPDSDLSLVKEIVEQHGGEVGVESEAGSGSKFSFTLPRL
jgi:hypothetical protein